MCYDRIRARVMHPAWRIMKKRSLLHTAISALIVLLHTSFAVCLADNEAPAAPAMTAPATPTAETAEADAPADETAATQDADATPEGQPEIGEMDISTLAGKILGVPQGTVQDVHIEAHYPQLDLHTYMSVSSKIHFDLASKCILEDTDI